MEIFNGMFCIAGWRTDIHLYPFWQFSFIPEPADTRMCLGNIKGIATMREADAKGAAAGKDAEESSLCHFAGQNRSGRKKRFRKKSTLEHAVYAFSIFRMKANFRS